jgi:trk system potassium uptake protein
MRDIGLACEAEHIPEHVRRLEAMHIVIMGCGRVGSMLARSLEKRGHTVAVIDSNVEAFRRLGPDFHGITVKGVGFDREVLLQAGIEHADGFAAVSSGDNSNILAARVVREEFGIHNVAARIYDHGRAAVYERLGIPTVATVRWAATQVIRTLFPEGSAPVWSDPSGRVRLVQMHHHDDWVGLRADRISELLGVPVPFFIRFGQGLVPTPATLLQDGDLLYVAVESDHMTEVEMILSAPPEKH